LAVIYCIYSYWNDTLNHSTLLIISWNCNGINVSWQIYIKCLVYGLCDQSSANTLIAVSNCVKYHSIICITLTAESDLELSHIGIDHGCEHRSNSNSAWIDIKIIKAEDYNRGSSELGIISNISNNDWYLVILILAIHKSIWSNLYFLEQISVSKWIKKCSCIRTSSSYHIDTPLICSLIWLVIIAEYLKCCLKVLKELLVLDYINLAQWWVSGDWWRRSWSHCSITCLVRCSIIWIWIGIWGIIRSICWWSRWNNHSLISKIVCLSNGLKHSSWSRWRIN